MVYPPVQPIKYPDMRFWDRLRVNTITPVEEAHPKRRKLPGVGEVRRMEPTKETVERLSRLGKRLTAEPLSRLTSEQFRARQEGALASPKTTGEAIMRLAANKMTDEEWDEWRTAGVDVELPGLGKKRLDLKGLADFAISVGVDPLTYIGAKPVGLGITRLAREIEKAAVAGAKKAKPFVKELAVSEAGMAGRKIPKKLPEPVTPKPAWPTWVEEKIEQNYKEAINLNLVDKIIELSKQRKTAKEIVDSLSLPKGMDSNSIVRSVRAKHNIPSMDDKAEFESWLSKVSKKVPEPVTPKPDLAKIVPKAEVPPVKPPEPPKPPAGAELIEQIRATLVETNRVDEVLAILPDGTALTGREFKGIGAFQHLADDLPPVQDWLDAGVIRVGLEADGGFFAEIRGGLSESQFSKLSQLMAKSKLVRVDFGYFQNEITKTLEGTPNIVRSQLRELIGTPGFQKGYGPKVPSVKPPVKPLGEPPLPQQEFVKAAEALTPAKRTLKEYTIDGINKVISEFGDRIDPLRPLQRGATAQPYSLAKVVPGMTAAGENILRKVYYPAISNVKGHIKDLELYMSQMRNLDIQTRNPAAKLPGGVTSPKAALVELKRKVGDQTYAQIEDTANLLWQANDGQVLKPLLDEGIISPKEYLRLKRANPHYLPFQREDFMTGVERDFTLGEANVASRHLPKLDIVGSERKLDNPLSRFLQLPIRTQVLVAKNKAAKATVAALQETGELATLVKGKAEHSKLLDTISFFKNGQEQTYQVPRPYAVAAKSMDTELNNAVTNFFRSINAPFKGAVTTYNPAFIPINAVRDAISAFYREKLIPFSPSYIKGWVAAIAKNTDFDRAARVGALSSGIIETQRSTAKIATTALRGALEVRSPKDALLFLPRLIEQANLIAERATRLATFIKYTGKGFNDLDAGIKARDVSVDFAKAGNTMRLINQVIPFSNAGVQGAINVFRTMKSNPKWALAASSSMGFASVAAWVNNQRFETAKLIPEYEYRYNWVFQVGEGKDKNGDEFPVYVKIPKGPMGSALTAPVEMAIRVAWGDDDRSITEDFLKTGLGMVEALSPIEPTVSGILPPAAGTAVGVATGRDLFRDAPIVPQREQQRLPEQQFGAETNRVAVALGQRFKVSPRLIDYAIKDYLGGAGQAINWVANIGLEALGYKPVMFGEALKEEELVGPQKLQTVPVAGRFVATKATAIESREWQVFNKIVEDTRRQFYAMPDMLRLGVPFSEAGNSIEDMPLTPGERAEYQLLIFQRADAQIKKYITNPQYVSLADEEKKQAIQDILNDAREESRHQLLLNGTLFEPHRGDDEKIKKQRAAIEKDMPQRIIKYDAKQILKPYFSIEDEVWAGLMQSGKTQLTRAVGATNIRQLSDRIKVLEKSNLLREIREADRLLMQFPEIVQARQTIARREKMMLNSDPVMRRAYNIFYGR